LRIERKRKKKLSEVYADACHGQAYHWKAFELLRIESGKGFVASVVKLLA
jgi:hypothetical protein